MQRISKHRDLQSPDEFSERSPADPFCLCFPICDEQVAVLTLRTEDVC